MPHISVHSPPNAHHRYSITCTRPGTLPTLNDGQVLTLKLLFDARTRRLWGWLVLEDDTELCLWQTTIPNRDVNIDGPDGDTAANTGEDERVWHVGITGATGGLYQTASSKMIQVLVDIADASARGMDIGHRRGGLRRASRW